MSVRYKKNGDYGCLSWLQGLDLDLYSNWEQKNILNDIEREHIEAIANSRHEGKQRKIDNIYCCNRKQIVSFENNKYKMANVSIFDSREVKDEYYKTGFKDEHGESTWKEDWPICKMEGEKRIYPCFPMPSDKHLAYFLEKRHVNYGLYPKRMSMTTISVIIFEEIEAPQEFLTKVRTRERKR